MAVEKRLMHYASFDTQSSEESTSAPSTEKQLVLARELKAECEKLGFDSVELTDTGIVYAYLNANTDKKMDRIGFIAHMDTASEITGANVKCRVISKYDGNTIQLNEEYSMSKEEFPALANCIGDDLIVTDGTTLLGADDKAGIAIILEAMEQLIQSEKEHGFIAVAFTPDEEIGMGPAHFDVKKFGADYAYTLDGDTEGEIQYENFNACSAKITFQGVNVHPGSSKNTMINAALVAMEFNSMLPAADTPRNTDDYEGFFRHEISVRKATGFPPYTEIVRVMVAGEDETAAIEVAKKIYTDVSVLYKTDRAKFAFLGCMKAPLKKLQGKFRYQILMRMSDSDNSVKDFAAACADKYKTNKVNAYIEVNPNNLT